mmetsp:Transcript_561/g.1911  ORF Transcript_561/g.1911 Transcript_561/m.1911 type:complete len:459 (-) Transcript_561:52-1428(-)
MAQVSAGERGRGNAKLEEENDRTFSRMASEEVPKRSESYSSRTYIKALYEALVTSKQEGTQEREGNGFFFDDEFRLDIQDLLQHAAETYVSAETPIDLRAAIPSVMGAMEDVVSDSFNKCFESHMPPPWNWNIYLFPAWLLGAMFRYLVMFPVRVMVVVGSTLTFLAISTLARAALKKDERKALQIDSFLMWYLANAWIMAWGGVIRYEGRIPEREAKQIYVANHTSIIDVVVLLGAQNFAVVGQHHPRPLGFFQDVVLKCLNCIWFDRKEVKDRSLVRKRIQDHVNRADIAPLLIFPEGTCVNNRYTVMFKKGAFELDADVIPIALSYNNIFVDAFWDTRNVSFLKHMFNLFTSWALICDVTFLPRQRRREDESAFDFAKRVQMLISDTARLEMTEFDGYFKHIRANDKFKKQRQVETAKAMKRALTVHKQLGPTSTKLLRRPKNGSASDLLRRRQV